MSAGLKGTKVSTKAIILITAGAFLGILTVTISFVYYLQGRKKLQKGKLLEIIYVHLGHIFGNVYRNKNSMYGGYP